MSHVCKVCALIIIGVCFLLIWAKRIVNPMNANDGTIAKFTSVASTVILIVCL